MAETVEMKLFPCPFCGDAFVHAELVQPDGELWGVHCPNGRCPTIGNFVVTGFSEEEVVADWNRRASPSPTVDAEEVARIIAKTHRGTSSTNVSEAAREILALLPAPGEVERLREALRDVRVFVQDCLDVGSDRTMIGDLMSARDVIDAALKETRDAE